MFDSNLSAHQSAALNISATTLAIGQFPNPGGMGGAVMFVDRRVADFESLVAGAQAEVFVLDENQDGIAQISQVLAGRQNLSAIHIVSHGSSGDLLLGQLGVNQASLDSHQDALLGWQAALSEDADILLYGCEVGQGSAGLAFVQRLADLTGADVAASDDVTGNAALGGDWDLEVSSGAIEANLALTGEALSSYQYILPTVQFDITSIFNKDVIHNSGDSINDVADVSNGGFLTDARALELSSSGNGLPNNGFFAANGSHPDIQLAYNNSDGGLNVWQANTNSIVNYPTTPGKYTEIHIIATSTEGSSGLSVNLNYSDNTTSTSSFTVADWFNPSGGNQSYTLISGMDRISLGNYENANRPSIFGFKVTPISGKTVTSVTLGKTSGGWLHVFGSVGVQFVNSAPSFTGNTALTPIVEDNNNPTGSTVSTLFAGRFSDPDVGQRLGGVAIIDNSTDTFNEGRWQYSTNGSSWFDIGNVNDGSSALALSASTLIRFLPAANYSGTPPELTVRALDSTQTSFTSGSGRVLINTDNNGGATPVSAGTNTIGITVLDVNDQPTLTVTPRNPNFVEPIGVGSQGNPVNVFASAVVNPIENDQTINRLSITVTGLQDGADEVLFVNGQQIALVTGPSITSDGITYSTSLSGSTATLTLTKSGNFDPMDVQDLINSITYQNTNKDNPAPGNRNVTLSIRDSGGTANGGNDTSAQTLASTISITPRNDAPVNQGLTRSIEIADNQAALPYPATTTISGLSGTITKVTVTLNGVNHTFARDVDILLVSPTGESVLLLSDIGGASDFVNTTLTFDDSAANILTKASTNIQSGTYRPSNDDTTTDAFTGAAPAGPYSTSLSTFNGKTPNGDWRLFVRDDFENEVGNISGGWGLTITTTTGTSTFSNISAVTTREDVPYSFTGSNQLSIRDDSQAGNLNVTLTVTGGTLNLATLSGLSGSGNNSNTLTYSGNRTNLNAALATLKYTPANDFVGTVTLTMTTNDNGNTGGGPITVTDSGTITMLSLPDAPSVSVTPSNLTFTEAIGANTQTSPVKVFNSATTTSIEPGQLITSLTTTISGLQDGADERIVINGYSIALGSSSAATIAGVTYSTTVSGGTATVILSQPLGLTPAAFDTILTGITYQNTNRDNPTPGNRTITLTNIQDNGGTANIGSYNTPISLSSTIAVAALNDAPNLTVTGSSPSFVEAIGIGTQQTPVSPFANAAIDLLENGQTVTSLTFTVKGLLDSTNEVITIDNQIINLGSASSGTTSTNGMTYGVVIAGDIATVTLTKTAGLSGSAFTALVNGITYQNTNRDNPSPGDRIFTITEVRDSGLTGSGNTNTASLALSSIVNVVSTNDAPTLTISNPGNVTIAEGQTVTKTGTFSDLDSAVTFRATSGGIAIGTITQDDINKTWSWSYSPTDSAAIAPVIITAIDSANALDIASVTFNLTVNNVAPTATFSNGGAVNEGTSGLVRFTSQSDPANPDQNSLRYAYDFDNDGTFESGDGTYANSSAASSIVIPSSYFADGATGATRIVKGRILDKDGGFTDYTTTIDIINVAPKLTSAQTTLSPGTEDTIYSITTAQLLTGFSDVAADSLSVSNVTSSQGTITPTAGGFSFTPPAHANGLVTINYNVQDEDGGLLAATLTFSLDAVNDVPVLGGPLSPLTYVEDAVATPIAPTATLADVDLLDFNGGSLTVVITNGNPDDRLSILNGGGISVLGPAIFFNGDQIASFSGGTTTLTIAFNGNSTATNAQALLRNISYATVSQDPGTSSRSVEFVLTDGDGGTSNTLTQSITITPLNDIPTLTITALNSSFSSDAGPNPQIPPVSVFSNAAISTVEAGQQITRLSFTIEGLQDGVNERVVINGQSFTFGAGQVITIAGITYDIALNTTAGITTANINLSQPGGMTVAAANGILNGITYQNTNTTSPSAGGRIFTLRQLQDNGGILNGGDDTSNLSISSTIDVFPTNDPLRNDPPTLVAIATDPIFTEAIGVNEQSPAVTLFSNAATRTIESGQLINRLSLTIKDLRDGANERLIINGQSIGLGTSSTTTIAGLTYSTTVSGTNATIVLTHSTGLTTTAINEIVTGLAYQNTNRDNPTAGDRTITLTSLQDNGGTANGGINTSALNISSIVTVVPVNDAPTLTTTATNATFTEAIGLGNQSAPVAVFTDSVASTIESGQRITGLTLTVGGLRDGVHEKITIAGETVPFSDYAPDSAFSLTIPFSDPNGFSTTDVANFLNSITYQNTNLDDPTAGERTFSITYLEDNGGAASQSNPNLQSVITVNAVNDAPSLAVTSSVLSTFVESPEVGVQSPPIVVFGSVTINPIEAIDLLSGVTLMVSGIQNGTEEQVTFDGVTINLGRDNSGTTLNNFTYSVTTTAGQATLSLQADNPWPKDVFEFFLSGLTYQNTNIDNPTAGDRTFTITELTDDGGTANGGTPTASLSQSAVITVAPSNDSPSHQGELNPDSRRVLGIDNGIAISTAIVSGLSGNIQNLSVRLNNLNHQWSSDLDILLLSPTGENVILMSDVGDNSILSNTSLTFTDGASQSLPLSGTGILSGSYRPTNVDDGSTLEVSSTRLAIFNGINPNGTWQLFIRDDAGGSIGSLDGGWDLIITTASGTTTVGSTITGIPNSLTTAITTFEDQPLLFTGSNQISIRDVDALSGMLQVTLSVSDGSLSLGSTTGLTAAPDNSNSTLTYSGTLADLNAALTTLEFLPSLNFNGDVTLSIATDDLGNSGGDARSAQDQITITVTPVNDAPSLTVTGLNPTITEQPGTGGLVVNEPVSLFTDANTNTNDENQTIISLTLTLNGLQDGADEVLMIGGQAIALGGNTTITVGEMTYRTTITGQTATIVVSHPTGFEPSNLINEITYQNTSIDNPTPGDRVVTISQLQDNGGTANGGIDLSNPEMSSTITLVAINDAPMNRIGGNPLDRSIEILSLGGANPYPAATSVAGLSGSITKVTVTLNGFSHDSANDVDILLMSPSGEAVLLLSDVGGATLATNATLTFDDSATQDLIAATGIVSGTYRPSDISERGDSFPGIAPIAPYSTNLSTFNGINPNGTWQLFVRDDAGGASGVIAGGWDLAITTTTGARTFQSAAAGIVTKEDTPVQFTGLNQLSIADLDAQNGNLQVTLSVNNGTIQLTDNNLTGSGNNSNTLTYSGTLANLNAALATLVYTPNIDFYGTDSLTITTNDQGNTGNGSSLLDTDRIAITVTPVNDAPTLSATLVNPTFTEAAGVGTQQVAVNPFADAVVGQLEEAQVITNMTFTLAGIRDAAKELLVVDGMTIALGVNSTGTTTTNGLTYGVTIVSGTATVTLAKATGISGTGVNTLINTISYQNIDLDNPTPGDRTFTITQLKDNGGTADGGVDTSTLAVNSIVKVVAINDAPTLSTTTKTTAFTEAVGTNIQAAAVTLFSGSATSSIEATQAIKTLTINVAGIQDGTNEILTLDGTSIALVAGSAGTTTTNSTAYSVTVTGSTATVTLTKPGDIPPATISTIVNGITYQNTNRDNPTAGDRIITLTSVQDNGGVTPGVDTTALNLSTTVTVIPVNDAPTLTLAAQNLPFTEKTGINQQAAPVSVFKDAAIGQVETDQSIVGLTLTVSNLKDGDAEVIVIDGTEITLDLATGSSTVNGINYDLSILGTTATIVLTSSGLTPAETATLLNGITYQNTNRDNPTAGSRTFNVTRLIDSGNNITPNVNTSNFSTLTANVNVVPVNDAPTLTVANTSRTTNEGILVTNSGTFNDLEGQTVTLSASIGSVSKSGNNWLWSYTPTDSFAATTVTITANDGNGGISTTGFSLTVNNVAPTATLGNGGAVNEGTPGSVTFTGATDFSSVDATSVRYAYDFDNDGTWDIGGGSYANASTLASTVVPASYFADGAASGTTRTIKGRILDKDGGVTDYTTTIAVNNVAPAGSLSGNLVAGIEDTAYTITTTTLLAGFTDVPGDTIGLSGLTLTAPSNGGLINNNDGTFTFSPSLNFNGPVGLSYNVVDEDGGSRAITRTIVLDPRDDVPTLTTTTNAIASTFTEALGQGLQAAAVPVFTTAVVDPIEPGQLITSMTLTIAGLVDGAKERIVIDGRAIVLGNNGSGTTTTNAMSYSVAIVAGTARITLTKAAGLSPTLIGTVITGITYQNTDKDKPTPGDRTFTITQLTDTGTTGNGNFNTATLTNSAIVKVVGTNDVPTLEVNSVSGSTSVSGNEGSTITQTGTFNDFDGNATATLSASLGTITQDNTLGTWRWSYIPPDSGATQQVTITATDDQTAFTTATFNLTVNNVVPTASFGNGDSFNEGTPGTISFSSQSDPSSIDAASLRYAYDFDNNGTWDVGAATYEEASTNSSATIPASYFPDGAATGTTRTVKGRILDKGEDGGFSDYTTTITINNVAPALTGSQATLANGTEDTTYDITIAQLLQGFTDVAADTISLVGTPTLSASQGSIAAISGGYRITPTANYNGAVTLNYQVQDEDGGVTNASIGFTLNAVNDAPVNTVGPAVTTFEDTTVTITGLTISDADAGSGLLQVTLSVTNGTLTLGSTTGLTAATGNSSSSLTYSGTLTDLNTALATLSYKGNLNFNGTDTLTIATNDQGNTGSGGAKSDTDAVTINVTPVNDAPTLATTSAASTFTEATGLATQGAAVSVFSAATTGLGGNSSGSGSETTQTITSLTFTIAGLKDGADETIVVGGQTLTLGANSITTIGGVTYNSTITSGTATIVVTKPTGFSATETNNLITGLTYQNINKDNPTAGARTFTITQLKDDGGTANLGSDTTTLTNSAIVTVAATNDAPVNITPVIPLGLWKQLGLDIDGETQGDFSGMSVSLSADGKIIAIGAPYNGRNAGGYVRLYQLINGEWTQLGADIDGRSAGDEFGRSVSLSADGKTVAIGAYADSSNVNTDGYVRLYRLSNIGTWTQIGADIDGEAASDLSGRSVSLSADGNTVAIGAQYNDGNGSNSGHVRIYRFNGNSWNQLSVDINGEAAGNQSGYSVSLSADGNTIAIGAPYNSDNGVNSGHVRLYHLTNGAWVQLGADINGEAVDDYSGGSVSLSADGTTVAIGASYNDGNGSDSGHVRLYRLTNGVWTQLGSDIDGEAPGNVSGEPVSLSADGNTIAIGSYANGNSRGHVRLYRFTNNAWTQLNVDIDGEAIGDQSGYSVSLSADGNSVAIGAFLNDGNGSNSGHVRVYSLGQSGVINTLEDTSVAITGLSISDVDARSGDLSVTLSVTNGTLSLGSTTLTNLTGSGNGSSSLTYSGGLANLNTALATVRYKGNLNFNGSDTLTITTNDNGNSGTGGAKSDLDTVTINVTPVNDEPTLTATASNLDFIEGVVATPQSPAVAVFTNATSNPIAPITNSSESSQGFLELTFTVSGLADGTNEVITVDGQTIDLGSDSSGTTTTNAMGYSVTIVSGIATIVLTTTTALTSAQTNTLVNSIAYQNTNTVDPTAGDRTFTLTQLQDNGGVLNSGDDTIALNIQSAITVIPINDAPTLTATTSTPTFTEAAGVATQGAAVSLFSNAAASTIEPGQTIKALTLTVTGVKDGSDEKLMVDGTAIGLVAGPGSTPNLSYNLTISGTTATLTLSTTAGLTPTAIASIINNITYQNTNQDNPTAGDRTITLTSIQDNGGILNGGMDTSSTSPALTSTVTVIAINDVPTLTVTSLDPSFTESSDTNPQAPPVMLFSNAATSTIETGEGIFGLTFSVDGLVDGADETIVVDGTSIALVASSNGTTTTNGMGYNVTVAGGIATVTLIKTTSLSTTAFDALINGIAYQNTNTTEPTAGDRTITLSQIQDSGGTANGGADTAPLALSSTVTVIAVNDAPTLTTTALNPSFTEAAGANVQAVAVSLFSGTSSSTIEASQTIKTLIFTVAGLKDGSQETIVVNGQIITLGADSTLSSGGLNYSTTLDPVTQIATITIASSAGLSSTDLAVLVNGITYQNTNKDNPTAGDRIITLTTLQDSGGDGDISLLDLRSTVSVAGTNDAPIVTLSNMTSVTENVTGAIIADVNTSDIESNAVTYKVKVNGQEDDRFEVSGGKLKLKASASLDYETTRSLNLEVIATDNGTPNAQGSASATVTVLDVNEAPIIRNLPSVNTVTEATSGQKIAPIRFTIADPDQPVEGLAVSVRTGNGTLIPLKNITITGTGAERFLSFTPSALLAGTTQLTIVVRDLDGNETAQTITVRISPAKRKGFIQRLLGR